MVLRLPPNHFAEVQYGASFTPAATHVKRGRHEGTRGERRDTLRAGRYQGEGRTTSAAAYHEEYAGECLSDLNKI